MEIKHCCSFRFPYLVWFLKDFKLLLEEVPKTDTKLKELWGSSPHTTKLRQLYCLVLCFKQVGATLTSRGFNFD